MDTFQIIFLLFWIPFVALLSRLTWISLNLRPHQEKILAMFEKAKEIDIQTEADIELFLSKLDECIYESERYPKQTEMLFDFTNWNFESYDRYRKQ